MKTIELIRTVDGIETPAAGTWMIAANQPVHVSRRRGLRTDRIAGRAAGRLLVADAEDRLRITLELDVRGGDEPVLRLAADLVRADRLGRWSLEGTVSQDGRSRPVRLEVRYDGVYRSPGAAVAVLRLRGPLRPGPGARRPSRLELGGDLNAILAAAHLTSGQGARR